MSEPLILSSMYSIHMRDISTLQLSADDLLRIYDNNGNEIWKKSFRVIFFSDASEVGKIIQVDGKDTQRVYYGNDAKCPADEDIPTKEGYKFVGWDKSTTEIGKSIETTEHSIEYKIHAVYEAL